MRARCRAQKTRKTREGRRSFPNPTICQCFPNVFCVVLFPVSTIVIYHGTRFHVPHVSPLPHQVVRLSLSIHSPRCSPFQSLTPLRHFPFPCSPFRAHSLLGRSPFQSPSSIRSSMFPYSPFQFPPPPPNRSPFPGSAFSCSPFQRPLLSVFLFPVSVSPF